MSEYIIKNYEDGFELEQEKVGVQVSQDWINAHQTPADRLKEVYSQPEFDPETRHYCFKGDKMVGFLTSKVLKEEEGEEKKASLVFPSVLSGHEEAVGLLYDAAIKTLKEKGVKIVEAYASALCGSQVELANKYDFNYVKDVENIVYSLKVSNIDDTVDTSKVRKFDMEKDVEKWLEIIKSLDNLDDERVEKIKNELVSEAENIVAHLIIEEENEIVGTFLIFRNPIKKNAANLALPYVTDAKYLKMLVAKAAKIAAKSGIDYYLIWLFANRFHLKKHVQQLNVNYAQPSASLFHKDI
ncbi:MAG: hypothetical protein H7641_13885 [Candidatus Heimdallarchaeota archaeon]|nr:hypothetical protein [Candidatus Heimdallarchaeota archaeon]MCK4878653.1 hypothetical protein [Candidatus Heimdallarchaeota archaeon]